MSRWLHPIACTFFTLFFALCPSPALPQEQETQQQPAQEPAQEQADQAEQPAEQQQSGTLIVPGQGADDDEDMPGLAEGPAKQSSTEPTTARRKDEKNIYIIVKGDTLWDISNSFLKDPFLWPLIWKVNPYIANPDLIYPGQKIRIPLD